MERDSTRFRGFVSEVEKPNASFEEVGPWIYEMQELGYNYRITDLQCALGRSQLKKLPQFIRRRQEIVADYNDALADLPWLTTPGLPKAEDSLHGAFVLRPDQLSWHLYTVQIDFEAIGISRSQVMAQLRERGVGTQVLYIPVHLQPYYRQTYGYELGKCPIAEMFYTQALSLPLYPTLTETEIEMVAAAIRKLANV